MSTQRYEISYALYDEDDKFLQGFDTYEDLADYLDCSFSNICSMFARFNKRHPQAEIYKYLSPRAPREENKKVYECSRQVYDFLNNKNISNNKIIFKGSKIYKFWLQEN